MNLGATSSLGWWGIARLGLVQSALGSIVVLATSTMNRVMVVELALPAMVPGALVALHYFVQVVRPRLGHGSDVGGRLTPWIIGGMGVLALAGITASASIAVMESNRFAGIAMAAVAFGFIGIGVGASGTSLLVLLAKQVDPARRAAAATITWVMMIVGFIITATVAGHFLDPYSPDRLLTVTAAVAAIALCVTVLAVHGLERRSDRARNGGSARTNGEGVPFMRALRQVWEEREARRFAIFVFVSMLAYSAQDLILEPFAGTVFGLTPGESTQLAGVQHSGVLAGMLLVAFFASGQRAARSNALKRWTIGGCIASALALLSLAAAGAIGPVLPLRPVVFALGLANGAFAVAAIGSMMTLVARGREKREGVRMGLWGAAQAVAFGIGGFLGTAAVDLARWLLGDPATAYAIVFAAEAALFIVSATLAIRVGAFQAERAVQAEPLGARAVAGGGE